MQLPFALLHLLLSLDPESPEVLLLAKDGFAARTHPIHLREGALP
jgi:hypothetical protein